MAEQGYAQWPSAGFHLGQWPRPQACFCARPPARIQLKMTFRAPSCRRERIQRLAVYHGACKSILAVLFSICCAGPSVAEIIAHDQAENEPTSANRAL